MIVMTGLLGVVAYRTFRCAPTPMNYNQRSDQHPRNQTTPEGVHIDTPMNTVGRKDTVTVGSVTSSTINRVRRAVNDQYAKEARDSPGVNTFAKMVCQ